MKKQTLTIVVPCFNEQETVNTFIEAIGQLSKHMSIKSLRIDILFIDDGSTDNTLRIIHELSISNKRINYISFSRNFGKEAAIYAGLKNCKSDYCVIMDVDLQDPPNLLPHMYSLIINEGYDCIATRRISRKGEPYLRSVLAILFYRIIIMDPENWTG